MLVLRALGIGDLATAVPALRGLRAAGPRPLTLAAPGWLAPLVALTGAVDRHLPTADLAPRRWPVPPPGQAVNLHGRGPQSHRLLQAAHPATLHAFACAEAGHLAGPVWREQEHEVHRWCRLLRWYGIACDPADLALHRPPQGRLPAGVTVVHPGAKAGGRRWPAERFAEVARLLAAEGHRVVVTGSAGDAGLAAAVSRQAGLPASAVWAGRLHVGQLAGLVAGARLVVCGDTGVAHLATGYRTPSVVLFGPVSPRAWGPPPHRREHQVLWRGEVAGAPGAAGPHPALLALEVEEVLQAAKAALANRSSARSL